MIHTTFEVGGHEIRSRQVSYTVREVKLDGIWIDVVELYNFLDELKKTHFSTHRVHIEEQDIGNVLHQRGVIRWSSDQGIHGLGINFLRFQAEVAAMLK